MTAPKQEDVVTARSLLLLAGMTGIRYNGQPIRRGPELIVTNGVEYVQLYTGDEQYPEAFCRYLLRADALINLGDADG